MTSEAIVIGVNKYQHLQPLDYAQQDAKAVAEFLKTEARFDHVYYFAEDAEPINGVSMQPTQNNLRRILQMRVAKRGLGDGNNFWFFFSGHGMRDGERDFLMPIDGYGEDVAASGISTAQVSEWLRGCGADNVVMILDACRNSGRKDGKGIGDETREDCRQTGVISLFSCSPNQFSYELPQYQQGAFTKALLEGLGTQGACATVARLDEYLKRRVPEVVRECLGDRVNQFPYSIAEPINKSHLILMPQHSRPEDLNVLKMDAFRAHVAGDLRSAYRCWLRVNIASRGMDMEAIVEIAKLYPQISRTTIQTKDPPVAIDHKIVDYSKLQQLLKDKQWRKADGETHNLMNNIIGTASLVRKLKTYPQDTIVEIDRLWADASDEKFGFFAQARIWQQVNRDKSEFEIRVGWRLPNAAKAINQSKLKLNLEEAEVGHFPAFFKSWGGGGWSFTEYLLDRVSEFWHSGYFIPLESEKGIDYRKLKDLLKAGRWEESNQETIQLMLAIANRGSKDWLDPDSLEKFPSQDLKTIDQLWVAFSKGRFGFSIQKKIWEESGAPTNNCANEWKVFGSSVGWRVDGEWLKYSDLRKDPSHSPLGELPTWRRKSDVYIDYVCLDFFVYLFARKDL
ncbi:MAG: GUN4 domain-containing protein [Alkalinema sp. FL-bin-369]|nr:GUN4 domain-containing protein [Leptolyngbyaceae cyanobacterium LF-bin-369]